MSMERLEALQGMTDEVDAMNPSPEAAAAAAAQADAANAQDAGAKAWGGVMFIVGSAVCMLAPKLKQVYTEAACLAWGKNAQAVSEKRGWGSPSNLPEISLLASTLMLLVPTVLVLRAEMQQAEKNDPEGMVAKMKLWWRARRIKKGLASAAGRAASGGK